MQAETQGNGERERLKSAVVAIKKLQAKLDELEHRRREPIAVVGMGCRLPGGAVDPDAFWHLLQSGTDAVSEVPRERWDPAEYYDPKRGAPGKSHSRWGGFVDEMDLFDAEFFGISPREAVCMDPQQRVFMEVAWEALEDAGIAPSSLSGSGAGIFVGATATDYLHHYLQNAGLADLDAYVISGTALNALAGRLAHFLGAHGPSITLDTACSSSLVAVDRACRSLRDDECGIAIAGGVNLVLCPEPFVSMSRWGMLSPEGRCKTFDASADGYVRAEGCAVVVLKRLSAAIADRDRIHAVIRASAVNQDGPSSGLSVPNGLAQESLLRRALESGGIEPAAVGYIEAHGTGTSLGDPIEVEALGRVFDPARRASPLKLGSVKTNLGHLESAAGITAVLKVALMMRHAQIPPHLHLRQPSPRIAWDRYPFLVPTALEPWAPIDGKHIAGVSSFGASGTNAHVILEQPPVIDHAAGTTDRPLHVLTVSARTRAALTAQAQRLAAHLEARGDEDFADLCFTANTGRTHFEHRLAVTGADSAQARRRLEAYVAGDAPAGLYMHHVTRGKRRKIAFLFTGQGSQYVGMGRQLYESSPTFARALDRCAAAARDSLGTPLLDVLYPRAASVSPLDETQFTQPALFAIEYALVALWRSWGIEPDFVAGHSVGEYAAACAAGVLGLEDGMGLIAERGRLMQAQPAGGGMLAVRAPVDAVRGVIAESSAQVDVAAVNAPNQTVISGDGDDLQAVGARLAAHGFETSPLAVSHAFHSSLMEPMLDPFERAAGAVRFGAPSRRLVSNVSGRVATAEELAAPDYWRRQVREPVQFAASMSTLVEAGCDVFVEIGPHPVLVALGRECNGSEQALWLPSLRSGSEDWAELLASLARLHVHGVAVDWRAFDGDYPRRKTGLPTYAFQRKRYMVERRPRQDDARAARDEALHPCAERRIESPSLTDTIFETRLSAASHRFLEDHRVLGRVVFPATGYVEAARAAAGLALGAGPWTIEGVAIGRPLVLEDGQEKRLQIVMRHADPDDERFEIFSAEGADPSRPASWRLHASGRIVRAHGRDAAERVDVDTLTEGLEEHDVGALYAAYTDCGLSLGPRFRAVRRLWSGDAAAVGIVELDEAFAAEAAEYAMHPALLDACVQVVGAVAGRASEGGAERLPMPVGLDSVRLFGRPAGKLWSIATPVPAAGDSGTLRADVRIVDATGARVAELEGVSFRLADRATLERAVGVDVADWLYGVEWHLLGTSESGPAPLPALDALAVSLEGRLDALRRDSGLNRFSQLRPRLDGVCAAYVADALTALGCRATPGEAFSTQALAERLGIVPAQRRLFVRCLEMLAEDGVLELTESGGRWVRPLPPSVPAATIDSLRSEFAEFDPVLALTERCGAALAEAWAGRTDPLQLLFPGGDLSSVENLQRHSPSQRTYNALAAETVRAALAGWPANRPVRILEVGAGTGATTARVLPVLPADRARYVFTDVSPRFLTQAEQRFEQHAFVEYRLLDLERDPAEQGFATERFDIVIASNVIHSTRDLGETLSHVRRLLAPGGWLLMLELTRPQRWVDLSYGLTDGWWRFEDRALRTGYPLLSRAGWRALLAASRFDAVLVEPAGGDAREAEDQAMIVARCAPDDETDLPGTLPDDAPNHWLILADAAGVGARLADELGALGHRCELVHACPSGRAPDGVAASDPGSYDDVERAVTAFLSRTPEARFGVVSLWALDARPMAEVDVAGLEHDQRLICGGALHLTQALVRHAAGRAPRMWLCTRGAQRVAPDDVALSPESATVWGLGRVVSIEHPELRCAQLDLDPAAPDRAARDLVVALGAAGGEREIAVREGRLWGTRLARVPAAAQTGARAPGSAGGPCRLGFSSRGSFDNLRLERAARTSPGAGEIEIRVHASALNFRDVLNVMGLYPGDPGPPGAECAGEVVRVGEGVADFEVGDAVVALPLSGGFATYVTTHASWAAPKPANLSYEQAATFPSAFLTAHHTLHQLARLGARDRVLIHAAAGGVGLAAVMLAKRAGAEIFATAGSPEKRALLKALGVPHVMDSRSLAFADDVLRITEGRGVDVVLNSLADAFVDRTFEVTARGGRFVEIGKRGIWTPERVAALERDVEYFVVDMAEEAGRDPERVGRTLRALSAEFERAQLEPLPHRVFGLGEAREAFKLMARGGHTGKLVLAHEQMPRPPEQRPELEIHPAATYLITGGVRGLGLLTAQWLVERGARHLVLTGRSAPGRETLEAVEAMEAAGARVRVAEADAADAAAMQRLLDDMRATMPALRGVVHSAGVLDDGVLAQQTWDRFARVFAAKVTGSLLLDRLTTADALDFFVLYSSVVGSFGTFGQSNHAAANAFMDVLAEHRSVRGLPGLSIAWGAWSGVGAAVDRGVTRQMQASGFGVISPRLGLAALETALGAGRPRIIVFPAEWPRLREQSVAGAPVAPMLAQFAARAGGRTAPQPSPDGRARAEPAAAQAVPLAERLENAAPSQRRGLLVDELRRTAGRVLGLESLESLTNAKPLHELGLDSLMAVELRNAIGQALGKSLPATLLFDYPTIDALAAHLAPGVLGPGETAAAPEPEARSASIGIDLLDELEQLDDEDIDRLVEEKGSARQ